MNLEEYGKYLFLVQFHELRYHSGSKKKRDILRRFKSGRCRNVRRYMIDEQYDVPICTICSTLLTSEKMFEKTEEDMAELMGKHEDKYWVLGSLVYCEDNTLSYSEWFRIRWEEQNDDEETELLEYSTDNDVKYAEWLDTVTPLIR